MFGFFFPSAKWSSAALQTKDAMLSACIVIARIFHLIGRELTKKKKMIYYRVPFVTSLLLSFFFKVNMPRVLL